jgi:hypothetical protein
VISCGKLEILSKKLVLAKILKKICVKLFQQTMKESFLSKVIRKEKFLYIFFLHILQKYLSRGLSS